jgi:NADP-dependent 3-hydroxy acid dehydrogenase YdfG
LQFYSTILIERNKPPTQLTRPLPFDVLVGNADRARHTPFRAVTAADFNTMIECRFSAALSLLLRRWRAA